MIIREDEVRPLHVVKLGCGLGGLDWNLQVKPSLSETASKFPMLAVIVHL